MTPSIIDIGQWSGRTAVGYLPQSFAHPRMELLALSLPALIGTLTFAKGVSRERQITALKLLIVGTSATLFFAARKLWPCYRAYKNASYWGGYAATVYNWAAFLQPFAGGVPYGILANGVWYVASLGLKPIIDPIAAQFVQGALRAMLIEIGKSSLLLGLLASCDSLALSELLLTQPDASYWRRSLTLLLACAWITGRFTILNKYS